MTTRQRQQTIQLLWSVARQLKDEAMVLANFADPAGSHQATTGDVKQGADRLGALASELQRCARWSGISEQKRCVPPGVWVDQIVCQEDDE